MTFFIHLFRLFTCSSRPFFSCTWYVSLFHALLSFSWLLRILVHTDDYFPPPTLPVHMMFFLPPPFFHVFSMFHCFLVSFFLVIFLKFFAHTEDSFSFTCFACSNDALPSTSFPSCIYYVMFPIFFLSRGFLKCWFTRTTNFPSPVSPVHMMVFLPPPFFHLFNMFHCFLFSFPWFLKILVHTEDSFFFTCFACSHVVLPATSVLSCIHLQEKRNMKRVSNSLTLSFTMTVLQYTMITDVTF